MKTALLAFGLLLWLGTAASAQEGERALDARALCDRGRAKYARSDFRGAIADYDAALQLQPDYVDAFHNRGVVRWRTGDQAGALSDFNETIRQRPDDPWAFLNRGTCKCTIGDYVGGLADFDEAVRLSPEFYEALLARSNSRTMAGDLEGAAADCAEALRLRPDRAEGYAMRGKVREKQGDLTGALADFDEGIRLQPTHHGYSYRGKMRLRVGDLEGARADFDISIPLFPECTSCPHRRAEARALLGDLDGARADFERASDLGPKDGRAHLWCVAFGVDSQRLVHLMSSGDWLSSVAAYWLGETTREQLLVDVLHGASDAEKAERLCNVHALLGLQAERAGDVTLARESYQRCVETGVVEEHFELRFAKARLAALR